MPKKGSRENKAPAYQWYPKDARTDENFMLMTWEQRGIYHALLDHQWLHGSIPDSVDDVIALIGGQLRRGEPLTAEYLTGIWPRIRDCFKAASGGRLVNERLERQRSESRRYLEGQSNKGRAGALKRWGKKDLADSGGDGDSHSSGKAAAIAWPSPADPAATAVADLLNGDTTIPQVGALVVLWNEERQPGPKVRQVPGTKQRTMRLALKAQPNLADWRTVIKYLNGQAWANASGTGTHPNWRADLEWLCKPGRVAQYLEKARLDRTRMGDVVGRDVSRGRTGVEQGKYAHLKE